MPVNSRAIILQRIVHVYDDSVSPLSGDSRTGKTAINYQDHSFDSIGCGSGVAYFQPVFHSVAGVWNLILHEYTFDLNKSRYIL